MIVPRLAIALAVGASAVVAGGATAAPVKPCNLVQDAKDDTFAVRAQDAQGVFGPQEDAMDIVSADIATDAKNLTAVIRVKKLATSAGTAPGGMAYRFSFQTPGALDAARILFIEGVIAPSGTASGITGYREDIPNTPSFGLGAATVVVDLKASEVRITAPLTSWDSIEGGVKPGMLLALAGLDQSAGRYSMTNPATGAGAAAPFADVAIGEKDYKAGSPSCVVVGK